jgi:hypothetical protein
MKPLGVVEALDIIKEHPVSLSTVLGDMVLEALGFKGRKKALHHRIVIGIGFSAHAGVHAMALEQSQELS